MNKDRGDGELKLGRLGVEGYERLGGRRIDRTEIRGLGKPEITDHLASILRSVLRRVRTRVTKPARDVFLRWYIVGRRGWWLLTPSRVRRYGRSRRVQRRNVSGRVDSS